MFGKNQIVGQKYFKDAPENSLMVTSKFFTVQGEGPFMGMPAYFIRLSKCNLNCSFCDAFFDQGEYYTYEQLIADMKKETPDYFWDGFSGLVVLTGGEPYLQNIQPFINELVYSHSVHVQIESNGILAKRPDEFDEDDIAAEHYVVVSPKCSEKTGQYLKPTDDMLDVASCLKFVISADPESPYHTIPAWAFKWKYDRSDEGVEIFVSPMNIYERLPAKARGTGDITERSTKDEVISFWEPGLLDHKQNQANHEYAARYALDNNCRLNLQMHLYASLA